MTSECKYLAIQIREIQLLLKWHEIKSIQLKMKPVNKSALSTSKIDLIKKREEIVKSYQKSRIDRALAMAKNTNENITATLKLFFDSVVTVQETFETFYPKKAKRKKVKVN